VIVLSKVKLPGVRLKEEGPQFEGRTQLESELDRDHNRNWMGVRQGFQNYSEWVSVLIKL
jgi:hypothetical protein